MSLPRGKPGTEERKFYAMPALAHKLTRHFKPLVAEEVAQLDEEETARGVGRRPLQKHLRWRGRVIQLQITEAVVIADVERCPWMNQVRQQKVRHKILRRCNRATVKASQIPLQVEQLAVRQSCVVIQNHPQRQLPRKLIVHFRA